MNLDVSLGAAVLAGVVSFLSPCVLPLVPPYLCFITGATLEDLTGESADEARQQWRKTLLAALAFVLGFTTVFVGLGAGASWIGQVLRQHMGLLSQVAGIFIIIMGLHFLGLFRLGFLSREARYHRTSQPASLAGAYAVGLAFAFGWTPCIGPVLAAILSLAASEQDVAKGAGLLAVYSLGLGIPFVLSAAAVGSFLGFQQRFRRHLKVVERVMGVALIGAGVMFLTGGMQNMSYWLLDNFTWFQNFG